MEKTIVNLRNSQAQVLGLSEEETVSRTAEEAAWAAGATDRAWAELRAERDRLLAGTDWWAVSDRTMSAEQTAYRQALRDLPANTTDPANPTWPVKP
jgi:DnaJ-domain-containing protein 1